MEAFPRMVLSLAAMVATLVALVACTDATPTPTTTEPESTATATSMPTQEPSPISPLDIDPRVGRQHDQTLLRILRSGEHCFVAKQQSVDDIKAYLYLAYVGEEGVVVTLSFEGVASGDFEMTLPPETNVVSLDVNGEGPFAVEEGSRSHDPETWTLVFWPEPPIDLNTGDVDLSLHINLNLTKGGVARFEFNFTVPGELPCAN